MAATSEARAIRVRRNRRDHGTYFQYGAGYRLSQVSLPIGVINMAHGELKGWGTPTPLDSTFTQIDGPRTDVSDITRFWLNGYGAPWRVRNALGQETRIRYHPTWPGLADSILGPNRLASAATYNARGLPASITVYRPLGTAGANAVTTYQWHPSYNQPTSIRTLTGGTSWLVDSISYNADGTKAWEQRGTGNSPTRVTFTYTPELLPSTVVFPGLETVTFAYNARGNLRKEQSPSGYLTFHFADGVGRDTLRVTPRGTGTDATDSAQIVVKGVRQLTRYDAMSRDTLSLTIGPQVTLPNARVVPADTIRVRSTYDAEGNRLSLSRGHTRKLDGSQGGIFEMNPSQWTYDGLNRVTAERHAGATGWTVFSRNDGVNVTSVTTPRFTYHHANYDALNRVTQRLVPQVTHGWTNCHYTPGFGCGYTLPTMEGPTLCIAVDTLRYHYDVGGNLVRAENNWAKVRRVYHPNGLLSHDTLRTRRYETEAPGPCGGGDKHALAEGPSGTDWNAHVYGLRYEYDLAGRRTTLHHPDQLDACTGACEQRYAYNPVTGALDSLFHPSPSGGTFTTRFTYDDQLRLLTSEHPGSVSTSRSYDAEGRISSRAGPLTDDVLTSDASGRVSAGTVLIPSTLLQRALSLGYGGLGALQWAEGVTEGITAEEYKTDALGNRLWVRDIEMVDGVDRTKYHIIAAESGRLTETRLGTGPCEPPGVPQGSCHPSWYVYEYFQDHDASGNVTGTWGKDTRGTAGSAEQVPEESRSYYASDEKLIYHNRHLGWSTPGEGTGVFDEYRYDALGRRVYSRTRRPSTCSYPCEAYVERTVWDGDQVLYEIRSSGTAGVNPFYMDGEGSVAPGDDPNLYGIVAYAHAQGIDQPVGLLKKIPGSGWAYVTPHANWKGDWSYGTFSNGSLCLAVGPACPYWPGYYITVDGVAQGTVPPTYTVWWGSLIRNRADGSGLQYLRNRYYDPRTGRFTQQDPIGLAGGLNLYGFANGDPVNFSDPFGLMACEPPDSPKCRDALQRPLFGEELLLLPFALGVGIYRSLFRAGARAAVAEGAAAGAAGFATKSAARGALGELALPEAQAAAANRAIGRATTSTVIGIAQGEGGNVVVTLTRAGRQGRQVIESVISPDGTKTVVQRAYDAAGRLVHLDPKR